MGNVSLFSLNYSYVNDSVDTFLVLRRLVSIGKAIISLLRNLNPGLGL